MNSLISRILRSCLLVIVSSATTAVFALPTNVTVTPPDSARFFVGQKFDLRVEGKGTGPFQATIKIDGVPQTFTSGTQNSTFTDGITSPGFGGFNLRGYSNSQPGVHTIVATFTDASGTVSVTSKFKINLGVDSVGRERSDDRDEGKKVRNIIKAMPFTTRAGDIQVTASFGVSATGSVGPDLDLKVEGLIKVADQCLYASKQGGRDRTTGVEIPNSQALVVNG